MAEMITVTASQARVSTAHAQRYMTQLCKHWSHKFAVDHDDRQGTIALPGGRCTLEAGTDLLAIRLEANEPAGLARLEQVVEEHIRRFAFREELSFAWMRSAQ
jgi:hypothetical protein